MLTKICVTPLKKKSKKERDRRDKSYYSVEHRFGEKLMKDIRHKLALNNAKKKKKLNNKYTPPSEKLWKTDRNQR